MREWGRHGGRREETRRQDERRHIKGTEIKKVNFGQFMHLFSIM